MKNNTLRCSTFFAPDFDKSIQMSEYLRTDLKWNAYAGSEVDDTSRLPNWKGIADWRKQNQNYAELRTKLELDSITNHEIGKNYSIKSVTFSTIYNKVWCYSTTVPIVSNTFTSKDYWCNFLLAVWRQIERVDTWKT